ncbi:MAG: fatty acid desaturase [Gemmatimonadota bacterium]
MSNATPSVRPYRLVLARTRHGTLTAGIVPFLLLQLSVLLVFTTPFSWTGVAVCAATYAARMFFITGFYHRYFAHRTYRMGRAMQLVAAFLGSTAVQKGVLWWAAHHREHHRSSDTPRDPHNSREGFLHSHWLWFLYKEIDEVSYDSIPELTQYPELVWMDRYWLAAPVSLAAGLYLAGGWHLLVWGFLVSTVLVENGTNCINSLMHYWGRQYFQTGDESRNHWLLALLTLGEGWHNNHHRYQASARNGFYWHELDPTYWILRALSLVGLVRDLQPVPAKILEEGRYNRRLIREARRMGRNLKPVAVLRGELQEIGDQVSVRVRILAVEVAALAEQVAAGARAAALEMQTFQEQAGARVRQLQCEVQGVSGQMASGGRALQREMQALQAQVAETARRTGLEVQRLNDQAVACIRRLGADIQALRELAARKGRQASVEALQEQSAALGRRLREELQAAGDQVAQGTRALVAEIEALSGLRPGAT